MTGGPLAMDRLGDGPVLLQLFLRGNPFRAGRDAQEPWAAAQQLIALNRLAGVVVYGSPYLWDELQSGAAQRLPCRLFRRPDAGSAATGAQALLQNRQSERQQRCIHRLTTANQPHWPTASNLAPTSSRPVMLSLSMIVRDEEARLGECLASVQGFADELVVVDTGSTDATVAIAEAAGARVEQISWPGDFAPARNQALEFLNGDWVLVLDADERLQPEVVPQLRQLMAEPDVLVINLLRHEVGAAMAPYSSVSRLFRRHPSIRWSRPYHSMIDDSVDALLHREPQWRIADCSEPAILHDGYRPELLAGSDKAARLRKAMESELAAHPGDPYASAKLGGLLISEGKHEAEPSRCCRTASKQCDTAEPNATNCCCTWDWP